ncbi:metal ABC transporter ATP-binding protein [Gulosibacter sp. 10]|uniref:metal ABC transporter ATP-binding protein n=1 Tax=Gulosibacter sp. 10 TaxID=1255570 RepID=UPI00097EA459|nr:metal ABC transporter ATP-binding protein [Gulosibacter sp. 10]SJM67586.1 Manganese ABC transporter, ATP-binding protein SitB [Gulosibacter sp. 10]
MAQAASDGREARERESGQPAVLAELRDVTLSYDGRTPAATGLDLAVREGEALALVGPNASGKSTTLKSLLGLVRPIAGAERVLGGSPRRAAREIGYMPQTDEIDPEFPVSLRQVVMMGRYRRLGPLRWPGRADREAVDAALERVDLADRAHRRFGDLSGGQQQRGLLARALVTQPRMLLLDEPFNGLDTTSRQALMRTLRELREEGVGIVVSTHDLELAHQVCSHVLLINRRQIAFGPIHETLTPEHVAETFGESAGHFDTHDDLVAHPHPLPTPERSGL